MAVFTWEGSSLRRLMEWASADKRTGMPTAPGTAVGSGQPWRPLVTRSPHTMTCCSRSRHGLIALVGVIALAGACSDDEEAGGASMSLGDQRATAAVATVKMTELTMPELTDPIGVVDDIVIEECQLEKGAVRAAGTAVNSGDGESDIAITIIWMLNNSDDPISLASTTLEDVPAGDEVAWSVETDIERAAERCVINARRGTS